MSASLPRFPDERFLDRLTERHVPDLWSATSGGGMVSTAHYRATAAGVDSEDALRRVQEVFRAQLLAVRPDLDLPF